MSYRFYRVGASYVRRRRKRKRVFVRQFVSKFVIIIVDQGALDFGIAEN